MSRPPDPSLCVLFGSTGFLGRHLARAFSKAGIDVRRIGRRVGPDVDRVDDGSAESLVRAMDGAQVVIHAAGRINGTLAELEDSNVRATERVIAACEKVGARRIVHVSSAAAHSMHGDYGRTKRRGEEIVAASSVPERAVFRPTLVYGPGDTKNLASIRVVIARSPVVPLLGGGVFEVQPVHVNDAVSVLVQASLVTVREPHYNVAGPEQISLRRMLELLCAELRVTRVFLPVPLRPVQAAVRFYQALFPRTRLPVKQVLELDKHEPFDITLTRRDFAFDPVPFAEGLRRTFADGGV